MDQKNGSTTYDPLDTRLSMVLLDVLCGSQKSEEVVITRIMMGWGQETL